MAPLSKLVMPAIRAIWSYGETGYHSLTAIAIEERYPREAMKFAFQILGQDGGQLNLTKFLLVVDAPFSLGDFRKVLEYALERTQLQTDLFIIANLAMDSLDYTGPEINKGSKGILIGVGDPVRELPRNYEGDLPVGSTSVGVFCGGCLAVQGPSYLHDDSYAERLARDPKLEGWLIVFLVDNVSIVAKNITFLWSTFTRFEPAGDVYAKKTSLCRHHLCYDPPIVLDCRMKPGYPAEVVVDEGIMKQVTSRWKEYFPDGGIDGSEDPMGYKGFERLD
jgi:3-polyprenyl-4-hydroxybenzoate decarboxylase